MPCLCPRRGADDDDKHQGQLWLLRYLIDHWLLLLKKARRLLSLTIGLTRQTDRFRHSWTDWEVSTHDDNHSYHQALLLLINTIDDAPFFLEDSRTPLSVPPDDPILSYMRTNDSGRENEELRGIIDDLTLDIKRLKRKIRRYKEKDPPHLRGDKLFDVRAYGLSDRRKRRLERILQRFAADIATSPRAAKSRRTPPEASHATTVLTLSPDDDAHMAVVVMLFEQLLRSSAVGTDDLHLPNVKDSPSDCHGSWFSVDEMLNSVKQMITHVDIDFTRKAIRQYSTNLQLSADGDSLRWQPNGKRNESTQLCGTNDLRHKHTSSHQKAQSMSDENLKAPLGYGNISTKSKQKASGYAAYTFTTRDSETGDDIVSMISSGSELAAPAYKSDFRRRSSVSQSDAQQPPTQVSQGRVTYYNGTAFYIDYSGDNLDLEGFRPEEHEESSHPKGIERKRRRLGSVGLSQQERRRQAANSTADRFLSYPSEKDVSVNVSQCSLPDLSLTEKPLTSVAEEHNPCPKGLEASGVGGVVPDDNFAIYVRMEHAPTETAIDPGREVSKKTKDMDNSLSNTNIRPSLFRCRQHDQSKNLFKSSVVSSTHEKLSPSALPPATCGFFSSSGSDDDAGEDGDDEFEANYENEDAGEHGAFRAGLREAVSNYGESPTSMDSIERWSAQVVASLEDDETAKEPQ